MFRAFSRPSSGAQWLQWHPLVLPSYRGDSRALFVVGPAGRPARPRTQHDCHHDTKVKPEAATAVIELLMMGGRMPETCWPVNKRQDNKLENCCIWLVIYLNWNKLLSVCLSLTVLEVTLLCALGGNILYHRRRGMILAIIRRLYATRNYALMMMVYAGRREGYREKPVPESYDP